MPNHTHTINQTLTVTPKAGAASDSDDPAGAFPGPANEDIYSGAGTVNMGAAAVGGSITALPQGGSQSFNIENPYLGIYHCIAMQGLFPSRS